MASRQETVDRIVGVLSTVVDVRAKKMFGDWALYVGDRVVALVSDDDLFVKPTAAGRAFCGDLAEKPPYAGAKPCLVIPDVRLDDAAWLAELLTITHAHLPPPTSRPRRARRG